MKSVVARKLICNRGLRLPLTTAHTHLTPLHHSRHDRSREGRERKEVRLGAAAEPTTRILCAKITRDTARGARKFAIRRPRKPSTLVTAIKITEQHNLCCSSGCVTKPHFSGARARNVKTHRYVCAYVRSHLRGSAAAARGAAGSCSLSATRPNRAAQRWRGPSNPLGSFRNRGRRSTWAQRARGRR